MYYIFRFVLLLSLFLFSGCVRHDDLEKMGGGEGYVLRLQVDSQRNKTYASGEDNTVREACFMVFDAENKLERMQVFEQCPQEVVFSTLSKGQKQLYVVANYAGKQFALDTAALHGVKRLEDLERLSLSFQAEPVADLLIPMTYSGAISIPVSTPSLSVSLIRILSRVLLEDDLEGVKAEWVSFNRLTDKFFPWAAVETAPPPQIRGLDTVRFLGGARTALLYVLPTDTEQVEYTVLGKSETSVTKVYNGVIHPKIGMNKSFTMSLSSGKLSDDGTPSDLSLSLPADAGMYDEARDVYSLKFHSNTFTVKVSSHDEVEIKSPAWMQVKKIETKLVKDEQHFEVTFQEHRPLAFRPAGSGPAPMRTDVLEVYNKNDQSLVKSVHFEQEPAKYYVVMVAGQSNASGWDSTSSYDPREDAPSPRIWGFGQSGISSPPYTSAMYSAEKSTLDLVPLLYKAQGSIDINGNKYKSIHLPLGKELLNRLPMKDKDYDILVISNSAPASGFLNAADITVGTYNAVTMRPDDWPKMRSRYLFESRNGTFYYTMLDRIKYALGLNDENKFLGVVWLGGETDTHRESGGPNPSLSYSRFLTFTQQFSEDLNAAVPSEKMILGRPFGKEMWFNVDHSPFYRNWHGNTDVTHIRSHYYGGYKDWSPSTFIRLPEDVPMNGPSDSYIHFGNNGFRTHIAPLVAQTMAENGLLGDPSTASTRFVRQISTAEILAQCGTPEDADIQGGLLAYLPLNDPDTLTLNLSQESVHRRMITNNGLSIESVDGLIGTDHAPRLAGALHVRPEANVDLKITSASSATPTGWSVSLMLRRNRAKDNLKDEMLLIIPGTKNGLFYHQYQLESEAGHLTLAFQPGENTYNRLFSVVARLLDASYVRTSSEWVHYTYTYDNSSRICRVYMNGEKTMEQTLPSTVVVSRLNDLVLGGTDAHISHLCLWDRQIDDKIAFKVYLQGYYGTNESQINPIRRR